VGCCHVAQSASRAFEPQVSPECRDPLGEPAVCFRPRLLLRSGLVCFRGTKTGSSNQIGSRGFAVGFLAFRRDLPRHSQLGGLLATGIARVVEESWTAATRRRPPLTPFKPKSPKSPEARLGSRPCAFRHGCSFVWPSSSSAVPIPGAATFSHGCSSTPSSSAFAVPVPGAATRSRDGVSLWAFSCSAASCLGQVGAVAKARDKSKVGRLNCKGATVGPSEESQAKTKGRLREVASKHGWTRFASQGFSETKAGLKCHASVGESFVADLWTALAPTHTE